MDENMIKNELQKFNVTDAAIAKISADYMGLTINGLEDTIGFQMVHKARMDVKNRRIEVTKTGKFLREDAVKFQQAVIKEEKRIIGLLAPIEDHLQSEENKIEQEKARIKAEAEAKEVARIQARIDRICSFGAIFNGQTYQAYGLTIPVFIAKTCSDQDFDKFIGQVMEAKARDDAQKAEEEAKRKAEEERLVKIAAEQEEERIRLEESARKQTEESARIKAEQEAIELEKQRLIDAENARLKAIEDEKIRVENEKKRIEELEQAKKEAVEKALKDAEAKAKRDAEQKAEREHLAKITAEKKEARRPDKEKFLSYIDQIASLAPPQLKTPEAKDLLIEFEMGLSNIIQTLQKKIREL